MDRRPRLGSVNMGAIELQQVFALRIQLGGSVVALAATHATKPEVAAINAAIRRRDQGDC